MLDIDHTDLLIERPLKQGITVSPHHHEEQRQVRTTSRPIPIQIDAQTHLIAIFACIKCCNRTGNFGVRCHTLKEHSSFFLETGSFYNSPRVKQLSFTVFESLQPISGSGGSTFSLA